MTDGPLLWYLNRSTGLTLLALLTLATALGVLTTGGRAGRGVPRFATQALHRNVALLAVAMLAAHVATAVVDTYVDIRWWQAVVPGRGSTYRPLWLGLGAVALDLLALVTATSLLRTRMGHRSWRAVHLLAYAAWAVSLAHGLGIGTDTRAGAAAAAWTSALVVGCATVVAAAVLWRLGRLALVTLARSS